jgi:hypothetical protein
MQEHRAHRRFSAKGTAKDLWGSQTGQHPFSITNFSREGIGIGIPHDYSLRNNRELELRVQLLPNSSPVRIAGTLKWVKVLNGDEDFAMTGGVKCTEIHPIQLWRLVTYCYEDDQYEDLNK